MQRKTIRSQFAARNLGLFGFLAALLVASEPSVGAFFPRSFPTASRPNFVAVADLDGDSVPWFLDESYVVSRRRP